MLPNFEGIDLDGLAYEADKIDFPEPVHGRTVHIDADFLAYQVSYEKEDTADVKTFEDMKHNAEIAVETLQALAGATAVHLHLTPATSNKGNRGQLAVIKEYQANRKDKPKPRYLHIMRKWLSERFPGTLHELCEADDGMSSAQYLAIKEGRSNLSIIASKDKDLRMVPGLHLDWDTGTIREYDAFGAISIIEKQTSNGIVKKLTGYGHKWFWAQMLTGDTADNISGLPKISGRVLNVLQPTKAILKVKEELAQPGISDKKRKDLEQVLASRTSKSVGPAMAFDLIGKLNTEKSCYHAVKELYKLYGEETGYQHWSDGSSVPWGKAFLSEAQLLWMRENPHNDNCVLDYWRQIA